MTILEIAKLLLDLSLAGGIFYILTIIAFMILHTKDKVELFRREKIALVIAISDIILLIISFILLIYAAY